MSLTTPTRAIAELIQAYNYDSLPEEVRQMARLALLDTWGCAIRGSAEPLTGHIAAELLDLDIQAKHFVPGQIVAASPLDRGLLFGAAAHAIDFDDAHPAFFGHLGSVVIGAVAALWPGLSVSGKDLLTAIVAGYEAGVRLNRLLNEQHYLQGFHVTGTVGVMVAAATSARLLHLDTDQLAQALGLAGTQASGLKATFGTMSKPYNAGHAAGCGALAARLVARGFTAPDTVLEDDKGFLRLYMGLPEDQWALAESGSYTILDNMFKFHAACGALHPMINAIQRIRCDGDLDPDNCEEIQVEAPGVSFKTASILEPASGLDCKFSYPQVAVSALCGLNTAAEDTYSERSARDPRLAGLRQRVTLVENNELPPQVNRVTIRFAGGDSRSGEFDMRSDVGSVADMTPGLLDKFAANTAPYLGEQLPRALADTFMRIDAYDNLADIPAVLHAFGTGSDTTNPI